MDRTPWVRAATAAAGMVVVCLAGVAQNKPAATTFIGELPAEPPARVAVVVEGTTFLAYACGKTDEFNRSASAWFKGAIKNGRIEAANGEKKLTATLDKDTIRGTLTADGRERAFTAKPVPATATAGLYRATRAVGDDTLVFGWIVDSKHLVVGGCHGKQRPPIALQPKQPLPPPPPPGKPPAPEQKKQVEDLLIRQVDEEPEVVVQGDKVTSAVNPPDGKILPADKE